MPERRPLTIFLDRDGVINRKRPEDDYVKSWEEFEFLPGALEAIRQLSRVARRLIVITNQRGIALGRMSEADLGRIHDKMLEAIRAAGGRIDAVYWCPHDKDACECRKPGVALFHAAKREFPDIEFAGALLIGDSLSDLEAAARLGCRAVLIAGEDRQAEILDQARRQALPLSQAAPSLLDFSRRLAGGGCGDLRGPHRLLGLIC